MFESSSAKTPTRKSAHRDRRDRDRGVAAGCRAGRRRRAHEVPELGSRRAHRPRAQSATIRPASRRSAACRSAPPARLVRRDQHRRAARRRAGDQVHDLEGELGVEVAGRLVGEQDLGLVHERARERDALLLAARERERDGGSGGAGARRASASRTPGRAPAGAARRSRRARRATFSSTVRRGSSLKSWNTTPMRRRSAGMPVGRSRSTLRPSTRIWPSLGRSAAKISRISVRLARAARPGEEDELALARARGSRRAARRCRRGTTSRRGTGGRARRRRAPGPRASALTSRGACAGARSRRGSRGSPRRAAAPGRCRCRRTSGRRRPDRAGWPRRSRGRVAPASGARAGAVASCLARRSPNTLCTEALADQVVELARRRGAAARPCAASPSGPSRRPAGPAPRAARRSCVFSDARIVPP